MPPTEEVSVPELGLLSVHPHPDDESIMCGGVLARYAAAGHRVKVITCTRGEEGENLAGIDLAGEAIATVRERELADALAVLGVRDHDQLGYRDSGMAGSAANEHADSFARAPTEEAAARLARLVRSFRPQVVVSDDENGTYGHPDHVKAHAVTRRALELAADPDFDDPSPLWRTEKWYAIAFPLSRARAMHEELLGAGLASPFGDGAFPDAGVPGTPDELVTTRVDVRPWLTTKRAALAAHRSQIGPDSFFLNLPEQLAASVFGDEWFVLAGSKRSEPLENDLFAGVSGDGDGR